MVYQSTFTLPTGATTGLRIVLNADLGAIFMYDSTNFLVASIAVAAGIDPYGNNYVAGFTSYSFSPTTFTQIDDGFLRVGQRGVGGPDLAEAGEVVSAFGGVTLYTSGTQTPTSPDAVVMELISGADNQTLGSASGPVSQLRDADGLSAINASVAGAWVRSTLVGTIEKWVFPGLNAGFTRVGFANEFGLQYRIDAEDNLIIVGSVSDTVGRAANANPTIFTLPAAFRPQAGLRTPIYQSSGASGSIAFAVVQAGGAVIVLNPTATAANAVWEFALQIPMGNIL